MPFAPPEIVQRGYQRYDSVARSMAAAFQAEYVPTATFGLTRADHYAEGDAIHFNVEGSDVMGRELARALLNAVPTFLRPGSVPPRK